MRLLAKIAKRGKMSAPKFLLGSIVSLAIATPDGALAMDSALLRSLILPGAGQAHKGHYAKAILFGGAAIIGATGAFASQIHYSQAADQFYASKATYDALAAERDAGQIVSAVDIDEAYDGMMDAREAADSRRSWRNVFITTLVATYALNLVDVWLTKPHDPETAMRVEVGGERLLLTRAFRF